MFNYDEKEGLKICDKNLIFAMENSFVFSKSLELMVS